MGLDPRLSVFFFFFARVLEGTKFTVPVLFNTVHALFQYCSWDPQSLYSGKKNLKMGPTVLFIHLKIILLQCFQFQQK